MPRVAKRAASLLLPRPILAAGIGKPQASLAVQFSISASRRGVINVGSRQATTLIPVPACWQMVVPPRECHRAGSADRRARFLDHHILALARRQFQRLLAQAHRPSRRQSCVQLPGR
jgi:hypothetical protein